MWGRIRRAWSSIKASQSGTAMVEYAGMLAGIAIVTIASLVFLGGAVGGPFENGFAHSVIVTPLDEVNYAIDKNACKKGGWTEIINPDTGEFFTNQGECVAWTNHND
jgi:Flp pilus assembly pilin Flp